MRIQFANHSPVSIGGGAPSTITSEIEVIGITGKIADVNVAVDVDHSFTADLEMTLVGPSGARVLLVADRGLDGDNFRSSIFDDQAGVDVRDGSPPFTGAFRPEQSLEAFNDSDPNGSWVLEIRDDAWDDGGELKRWALDIEVEGGGAGDVETLVFHSSSPTQIRSDEPDTVVSAIHVTGHADAVVRRARVSLDIEHSFTQDLTLTLIGPLGTRVVLADRVGGGEDHFHLTTFADDAKARIRKGKAPFSGSYKPEEALAGVIDKPVTGAWRLEVRDHESGDGGVLKSWSVHLDTVSERVTPASNFHIDVEFLGGLSVTQKAVFQDAAARWSEIIVGDLPQDTIDGTPVDDVVIGAQGQAIDGAGGPTGNVLGQAMPTHLRSESRLPIAGIMTFDTHDLGAMEADGSLLDVVVHEMGHVLGIGTLWNLHGLLQDPADGVGVDDPVFTGVHAIAEYGALRGSVDEQPVPVADQGGPGTRNGHWRERSFDNELMTGWINQGMVNPISRITVASLADLGYDVNLEAADDYGLPALVSGARRSPGIRRECCTLHAKVDDRGLRAALRSRRSGIVRIAKAARVVQEVNMSEKIAWNVGVAVSDGPRFGESGVVMAEAYDRLVVAVPGDGAAVEVDVQPSDHVVLLSIQSSVYDAADLTYEVDGGVAGIALDGPQVLVGAGMVSLLGNPPKILRFTNDLGVDKHATVTVLVGRKAT